MLMEKQHVAAPAPAPHPPYYFCPWKASSWSGRPRFATVGKVVNGGQSRCPLQPSGLPLLAALSKPFDLENVANTSRLEGRRQQLASVTSFDAVVVLEGCSGDPTPPSPSRPRFKEEQPSSLFCI